MLPAPVYDERMSEAQQQNGPVRHEHKGCAAWYCLDWRRRAPQRGCRRFQAIDEAVSINTVLGQPSDLAVLVQTGLMHGVPTPQAATEIPVIMCCSG